VEFNENQANNLGKYFLDISKLSVGVYVFTSLPDKPLTFVTGLIVAVIFLIGGLVLLKGEKR
jgi:hypothetical protein